LLDDPGSHLIDTSVQALTSPSRSSPHSQGSESSERFSRKVFVGGLPPDIDEGSFNIHILPPIQQKKKNHISLDFCLNIFVGES